MSTHFLEQITITNFKCFKDFSAKEFKRVNLIGGKNSVGKTALLESLYINTYPKNLKNFIFSMNSIKFMRENLNILDGSFPKGNIKNSIERLSNLDIKSNQNHVQFFIKEQDGKKEYLFNIGENKTLINVNEFSFESEENNKIVFIDSFGFSNSEIVESYSAIQKRDKEQFLNSILNSVDERIKSFKIIDNTPQCSVDGEYLELTELGDGIRHLISIVASLYQCEGGYLFIDEIDNGIHYTQLDNLWKTIIEVSKELNCQLFATTHSKEMINSFARVSKKLEEESISFIELGRTKKGEIRANTYDKEMFLYELEQSHEVRGW